MDHRCYNCGNDPADPEICRVCGATQMTQPVGMFTVQPKVGADAATEIVEPDLAPPRPAPTVPSNGAAGAGAWEAPPAPQGAPPPYIGQRPPAAAPPTYDGAPPAAPAGWTGGPPQGPVGPPPTPDDDIVDATVIEDDEFETPPAPSQAAPGDAATLGSIFDHAAPPSEPGRSPFGQFANDPETVTHNGAGHAPSHEAFSEPGPAEHAPFDPGAPQTPVAPTPPHAAADTATHHGPDPHGLAAAARRMRPDSREHGAVALSIAAATMRPGELVVGAVVGSILGLPSAVVATDTRVIVVCDRRYAPEVTIFDLTSALMVSGRHANGVASVMVSDGSRSVSVDQIRDVSLAVEVVNAIRTRSSGTEF